MREDYWYKMMVISVVLHTLIIGAFAVSWKKTGRSIDLTSYSVKLVGDMGSVESAPRIAPGPGQVQSAKKPSPPTRVVAKPEPKKPSPRTALRPVERPVASSREVSLAPIKKKDTPQAATDDEARSLDERIRDMRQEKSLDERIAEMKQRTQYMDVAGKTEGASGRGQGSAGLPVSSAGGSSPLDPALQKYFAEVFQRIQDAWHAPGSVFKKNLQTVVAVRIRKDGRIIDIEVEKRSGNRIYDESVLRTLRSIDRFHPIPSSIPDDTVEMGFNFHPPGGTAR